ncbi:MAG: hypothetical protein GF364_16945 [Candidatus Lokiarchaeota archaeon]|nr:hypothetical protein [Candidatus Lokiarchaeota archaeon]
MIIFIQLIGLVLSISGFQYVKGRLRMFENHLCDNYMEAWQSDIKDGYELSTFTKDTYVNTSLYKDGTLICIIAAVLLLITYFIVGFLTKRGNKSSSLEQSTKRCRSNRDFD